jgi:hypothetical protein
MYYGVCICRGRVQLTTFARVQVDVRVCLGTRASHACTAEGCFVHSSLRATSNQLIQTTIGPGGQQKRQKECCLKGCH